MSFIGFSGNYNRVALMTYLEALILGVLQGLTEFIPISSSGHLVLGESWLGLNYENLKAFDVFVHLGTLAAILIYFWKDFFEMLKAFVKFVSGKIEKDDPYGRLVLNIVIGTVPAVVLGLFGEELIDGIFRDVKMVATSMIVVALFFLVAEKVYKKYFDVKYMDRMNWKNALWIGIAQSLALIPGVSRSGMTISAGILQGVERSQAARFSFLLGIPAIAGAGVLTLAKGVDFEAVPLAAILTGFFSAFLAGLLCIHLLLKFLKKNTLAVFAFYLIVLGSLVLLDFDSLKIS